MEDFFKPFQTLKCGVFGEFVSLCTESPDRSNFTYVLPK